MCIQYEDLVTDPVATLRPLLVGAGGDARIARLRAVRRLTTAHIGIHRERSAAELDAARRVAGACTCGSGPVAARHTP